MKSSTLITTTVAAAVQAAQNERTFAVLRFDGTGPMMEGRVDPIVSPGKTASHVHTIQGGSNMGISATGEDLMKSKCSSAKVVGDNSAYWAPKAYFHDKARGTFEDVPLYYMNVYYFFEPTDDDVVAFPVGLQMVSGDASLRDCPDFGGELQLDPSNSSGIQPTQWTCPRQSYSPPAWPLASVSNGQTGGIQDPVNQGAGQGFPFANCDGEYSPLRQDIHFPSCYDPSKGLTDYKNNMVYPDNVWNSTLMMFKQNCPEGFTHVPHLFFELYWNTIDFADRWSSFEGEQPFVLSNGDLSGCSAHGDFLAAWDTTVLQHIIDTCNAGDSGMDKCAGIQIRDPSTECHTASPIDEVITGNLTALPGNNRVSGWGTGDTSAAVSSSAGSTSLTETSSVGTSTAVATPSPVASSLSSSALSSAPASSSEGSSLVPEDDESNDAVNPSPSAPDVVTDKATFVTSANAAVTTTSLLSVTTLPNGKLVTKTVVDWVTVTTWVTQDVVVATKTVHVKAKQKQGPHRHQHQFHHRSPHHVRR